MNSNDGFSLIFEDFEDEKNSPVENSYNNSNRNSEFNFNVLETNKKNSDLNSVMYNNDSSSNKKSSASSNNKIKNNLDDSNYNIKSVINNIKLANIINATVTNCTNNNNNNNNNSNNYKDLLDVRQDKNDCNNYALVRRSKNCCSNTVFNISKNKLIYQLKKKDVLLNSLIKEEKCEDDFWVRKRRSKSGGLKTYYSEEYLKALCRDFKMKNKRKKTVKSKFKNRRKQESIK